MIGATGSLGALALTHSGRVRPVLNTALMVSLFYLLGRTLLAFLAAV
jgi:hypothetical protein